MAKERPRDPQEGLSKPLACSSLRNDHSPRRRRLRKIFRPSRGSPKGLFLPRGRRHKKRSDLFDAYVKKILRSYEVHHDETF